MKGVDGRRLRRRRVLITVGLLTAAFVAGAAGAGARQTGQVSGPTITLNPTSAHPGETTTVVFTDWQGRLVTLSVCGNDARRGSADCNLAASQGIRLSHVDDTPISDFVVSVPPGSCPCVVRASSLETNEVATAPIEIPGHPMGPVVGPTSPQPLDVALDVEATTEGMVPVLESALGGPTSYAVTVTVRNATSRAYSNVSVFGSVGRDRTVDLAGFDMDPFAVRPGETWTATTKVTLPAPTLGSYVWRVTASGAGPVATAERTTETVPWLAAVLVVMFIVMVSVVVVRRVRRRRRRRQVPEDDVGTEAVRSTVLST